MASNLIKISVQKLQTRLYHFNTSAVDVSVLSRHVCVGGIDGATQRGCVIYFYVFTLNEWYHKKAIVKMRKWNFQIPREEIVFFSVIIDGRSLGFYLIRYERLQLGKQ